jgi:poly-gamma-glutamate synthesis protein (capsule biosynthesis protein)
LSSFFFASCSTTKESIDSSGVSAQSTVSQNSTESTLTLLFAGDIMAHANNYRAGHFDRIWTDISPLLKTSDLAFANIEAPVNDKMDWSSYPQFNMHSEYVQAAVDAGFNVFSLANNHTNDWYLEGITATRTYFEKQKNIWAAGIKKKNDGKITYRLIEKNGWKVLFCAFTEILNRPDYASWIDYYPLKKHEELVKQLRELSSLPHDLFVISVHTDEEEYKTQVTESHRKFFERLIEECGADIIWANHPHVSKEFELKEKDSSRAFIMYANGNTVSGQRTSPSFHKSMNERDDTGDGLLIKVQVEKSRSGTYLDAEKQNRSSKNKGGPAVKEPEDKGPYISKIEAHFITTYIRPDGQFTVKLCDEDFIHSLERSGLDNWAQYLKKRMDIYKTIKGKSKWQ